MTVSEEVKKIISAVLGLRCNFRLVSGGSVILYFDDSTPKPGGKAPWTLHIEPAWRLEDRNNLTVGSFDLLDIDEDSNVSIQSYLALLEPLTGSELQDFEVVGSHGDIVLRFDHGLQISTFCYSADGEGWELRGRTGERIAMKKPGEIERWKEQPVLDA